MIKIWKSICLGVVVALVLMLWPASLVLAAPTLYESYNTGDNTAYTAYTQWQAQTFTATSAHNITGVRLKLYKTQAGTTGTVTVSIRSTDGSGHPTTADLTSASFDASALVNDANGGWYQVDFGTVVEVINSIKYAIVVRAPATSSGFVNWRADESGAFAGGNAEYSDNGGINWTADPFDDFMFEVWGDPALTAPSVTTNAATNVTATGATLNGNLTDFGTATPPVDVYFAWDTTQGGVGGVYHNLVGPFSMNATGAFSAPVDSLTPETTYYYITSAHGDGWGYGTEQQFTTTALATASEVWVDDDWSGLSPGDPADGHTFGVDAFDTIQGGVDAVVGSTVNVMPGIYHENIAINKSLVLQSTDGAGVTTIIGAPLTSPVIEVALLDGESFTLDGFTVTGGSEPDGYGVFVIEDAGDWDLLDVTVTITDNIITENANDGIGFRDLIGGRSRISISGNTISDNGDEGIDFLQSIEDDGQVTISGNTISGNGEDDDGIEFEGDIQNATVNISGNTIADNSAKGIDFVNIDDSTVTIDDNDIIGNNIDGIYFNLVDNSTVTIDSNDINDNGAVGIYFTWGTVTNGSTLTISNNDIIGNYYAGVHFGLIDDSTATIEGNDILDNGYEGIVFQLIRDSTVTIEDNDIAENRGGVPNGIRINRAGGESEVTIADNTISENIGYGVFLGDVYGESKVTISKNSITGNLGEGDGDGINIDEAYDNAVITIEENTITDNDGDGIDIEYVDGVTSASVVITGNTISDNADDGVDINYQEHDYQVRIGPCNSIFDNEGYGVNNEGKGTWVDATGCWWGDESGPGGEGPGSGDEVSENVEFDPWRKTLCVEEEAVRPVADFSATPTMGQAPLTVSFRDRSTGDIDTRFWNFGDGNTARTQFPTNVYMNEGIYRVTLTVTGPNGTSSKSVYITVESETLAPKLTARNLTITPVYAKLRQAITITADVFNEGGAWGSQTTNLMINSQFEQSVPVGVAAGSSQPISFTVYKIDAGTYQVNIEGATATFYVQAEETATPQAGGLLAGGELDTTGIIAIVVIGIILIGGVVVTILLTRRA